MNKKYFAIPGLFFLLFALNACTSASILVPQGRLQSPLVSGTRGDGAIGGSIGTVVQIDTVRDVNATPPDSSGADIGTSKNFNTLASIIGIKLDLGVTDWADVFYENGFAGARAQILGDQKHGWVGTLSAALGSGVDTESNEALATKSKTRNHASDFGVSLGYSVNEGSTPYLSYGHRALWAITNIDQTSNSYEYHGSGSQDIFALGYEGHSGHFGFQIETGYNTTYWRGASAYTSGFVAGNMAYHWGN